MKIVEVISKKTIILSSLVLLIVLTSGYYLGNLIPLKPANSATTPGTCLPIDKGGTGCDGSELLRFLGEELYPVGTVLTTTTNTNPESRFGGTWQAFGTGQTLVGVDTTQTEFDVVEESGGSKTVTLSVAQMPSHAHDFATNAVTGTPDINVSQFSGTNGVYNGRMSYTGGGQAHDNMPPYITVYFWKRVS